MFVVPLDSTAAEGHMKDLALHLRNFPKSFGNAIKGGLKVAGQKTKEEAVSILGERYWASPGNIGRKIKVKLASGGAGGFGVKVFGQGRLLLLSAFKIKPVKVTDSRGIPHFGVAAAVLRESALKQLGGKKFFGKGLQGKVRKKMAFERKGAKAHPIWGLYGPSVVGYFAGEGGAKMELLKAKAHAVLGDSIYEGALEELNKLGLF